MQLTNVPTRVKRRVERVLARPTHHPKAPKRLSGALPVVGHMLEFGKHPFEFLKHARAEGGEVVEFNLLGQDVVLMTGPAANEAFFRAPDDILDRREAYRLMTPIFGKGVVFDAPGTKLNEQMRMVMQLLRDEPMRTYPPVIESEVQSMVAAWGRDGEIDLLEFMKELTIYTSTHCLVGPEFRRDMTSRFAELYGHLEKAVNPIAYVYPYLPIPTFRRRDAARVELVAMINSMVEARKRLDDKPSDGLQTLLDARYDNGERLSPHEITGMLTAMMMAGHHTSAGTAAWTILELARRPELLRRVRAELFAIFGADGEITYQGLRRAPFLRDVLKEVLRLHPPLIFLFRKALEDFQYGGYTIEAGKFVCASPAISHRISSVFAQPEVFDPDRYAPGREEDNQPFAWISFGGGKHKCTGNAFATLQLSTIVALMLREFDFELIQGEHGYRDDYTKATVQPADPCRVRYHRRDPEVEVPVPMAEALRETSEDVLDPGVKVRVTIDRGLCQGHAVCTSEAPEIFRIAENGEGEVLLAQPEAGLYAALSRAYEFCPNHAIVLTLLEEQS